MRKTILKNQESSRKNRFSSNSVLNFNIKGCYVHNKQCSPPKMTILNS